MQNNSARLFHYLGDWCFCYKCVIIAISQSGFIVN